MFGMIWHDFLYQPLFNLLIWIYNNWTDQNLGWAIVILTVMLRVALLPFTLVEEKDSVQNSDLKTDLERVQKGYQKDAILQKEEIRKILRKRRVRPWSKVITLGVQLLVLILLYQVFLRGITGAKVLEILYPSIEFPGKINTIFYGFDLGEVRTFTWPIIVAVFLLVEIYLGYRRERGGVTKSDLMYFVLFPLATFFALYLLPMVKSLFILTTLIFSATIHFFSMIIFRPKKAAHDDHGHDDHHDDHAKAHH